MKKAGAGNQISPTPTQTTRKYVTPTLYADAIFATFIVWLVPS